MKRILLLVAALAVALTATVSAEPPPGKGPERDSVLGGGKSFSDIFNIAVHSGPLGEGAFGHFKAQNVRGYTPAFDIEVEVTCLRVSGDLATIGGRATKLEAAGYSIDLFPGVIQFVRDGAPTGTADAISYQFPVPYIPTTCPAPNAVFTIFPLLQGNINVNDE